MGFFVTGNRGTIRGPKRCNPTDACLKLYQGMKGIGTDEAAIISVVAAHNSKQRQQIRKKYQQVYKKDLMKELDGELSFVFGRLVAALMSDPEDYILECIHKAVVQQSRGGKIVKRLSALFKDGLGKTEYSLLSLVFPRTNKQLQEIKEAFQFKYQLDMEERIALGGNDLPQDFCTLVLDILGAERDESEEVDEEQLEEDLDCILEGGASGEEAFQEIMLERSFNHLKKLFEKYLEEAGKPIEDFIDESEGLSAELKETYKGMTMLIVNEPVFYADRLKQAIQGAGTDDETLIRIIVLRSEVDLLDIMDVYENKFGLSLADDVAGDTSGDYKDILLKIIAVPDEPVKEETKMATRLRNRSDRRTAQKKNDTEEENVEEKKLASRSGRKKQMTKQAHAGEAEDKTEEEVNEKVTKPRSRKVVKTRAEPKAVEIPAEVDDKDDAEDAIEEQAVACKSEPSNEACVIAEVEADDEAGEDDAEEAVQDEAEGQEPEETEKEEESQNKEMADELKPTESEGTGETEEDEIKQVEVSEKENQADEVQEVAEEEADPDVGNDTAIVESKENDEEIGAENPEEGEIEKIEECKPGGTELAAAAPEGSALPVISREL